MFHFDIDAGLSSTGDLPEFTYRTFKDVPWGSKAIDKERGFYPWGTTWTEFFNYLNDKVWPEIEKGTFPHQYLGVDSLTTLSGLCMNYVLKTGGKTGKEPPTLPDHGSFLRLMESTLEQLASWPIGLILTAHVKRDENLNMGTKEFLPLMSGQLSGRLGIYFDEVYYTYVEGKGAQRVVKIKTAAEGMYVQAKSRRNVPTDSQLDWKTLGKYFA